MASKRYQELFIVNGNLNEYVLPEDLLDEISSLDRLIRNDQYKNQFSQQEKEILEKMFLKVRSLDASFWEGLKTIDLDYLVNRDALWDDLRSLSGKCLNIVFGVNCINIDSDQIDD